MVVAKPIHSVGGVLPNGTGTEITSDPDRRHPLVLKGVSGTDQITTHIHSKGTNTLHNSSGESNDGFGRLGPATEKHHDRRQVLRRCKIR